jgi:hypothetical protein
VGVVADGDDEVAGADDVADVRGAGAGQGEPVPAADADGVWVDPVGRVSTGRGGRDGAGPGPRGGGELGSGGVVRADEDHALVGRRRGRVTADQGGHHGVVLGELHVAAAAVALGADPPDQTCLVEVTAVPNGWREPTTVQRPHD